VEGDLCQAGRALVIPLLREERLVALVEELRVEDRHVEEQQEGLWAVGREADLLEVQRQVVHGEVHRADRLVGLQEGLCNHCQLYFKNDQ